MKKSCKFKFLDREWTLERWPASLMEGNYGMIWEDVSGNERKVVVCDTLVGMDFCDTVMHELAEQALCNQGCRFDESYTGAKKFIMLMDHEQFNRVITQVVTSYEEIRKNIGFTEGRKK